MRLSARLTDLPVSRLSQAISAISAAAVSSVVDTLQAVRDLDTSNGGDFTVSILDMTKAGRVFTNGNNDEADDDDSVELVVDDIADAGTEILVDASAARWTPTGNNTVTDVSDGVRIDYVDGGTGASFTFYSSSAVNPSPTDGAYIRVEFTAYAVSGSAVLRVSSAGTNPERTIDSATPATYVFWFRADAAGATLTFSGFGSGDSIVVGITSVQEWPGAYAEQTTAASQPTVTTDAFGNNPLSTDGGDDGMNLPDGWLGDGTQSVAVSIACSPDEFSSAATARFIESNGVTSAFQPFLRSGEIEFRAGDGGSTFTDEAIYSRRLTPNEPIVVTFYWAPGEKHRVRVNGQLVAESISAFASLDNPGASELFYAAGASAMATLCWGATSLVGGTDAWTDATLRACEAHLASIANVTLAPQTRAEALTAVRRPATPATDLNVSEGFDYADTAALTAVWDDTSPGGNQIEQGTSQLLLVNDTGSNRPRAEHIAGYPVRVGYRYQVAGLSAASRFDIGTTKGGNDIANAESGDSFDFEASTSRIYVSIEGSASVNTQAIDEVTLDEIARTAAIYDFLNEANLVDEDGTQVALGAGIPQVLPSVAEGDDRFGDTIYTLTANDSTGGNDINSSTVSGADPTVVRVTCGGNAFGGVRWSQPVTAGVVFRLRFALDDSASANDVFYTYDTSGSAQEYTGPVDVLVTSPDVTFQLTINWQSGDPGDQFDVTQVSLEPVLYYPLQQTAAASQPTLSYTLAEYLSSVVFSGKEEDGADISTNQVIAGGGGDGSSLTGIVDNSGATTTLVSGAYRITSDGTLNANTFFTVNWEEGETYYITADIVGGTYAGSIGIAGNGANYRLGSGFSRTGTVAGGTFTASWTADLTTTTARQLRFRFETAHSAGEYFDLDNILVVKMPKDLSVSNNASNLIPNGTLTVSTPTVGGETALSTVYSGFSGSNYLETADGVSLGTDDFSFTVVSGAGGASDWLLECRSSNSLRVRLFTTSDGFNADISDDGSTVDRATSTTRVPQGGSGFDVLSMVRRGSTLELWQDGALADSVTITSATGSLTFDQKFVGNSGSGSNGWAGDIGTIQLDTSGYAPTADEIANIHADLDAIYNRTTDSYVFAQPVWDGGDDSFSAVDPDDDLAITGDVTIIAAAAQDDTSGSQYVVQFGDPAATTTDIAGGIYFSSGQLAFVQADASTFEVETHGTAIAAGTTSVLSAVRDGSSVVLAVDTTDVESKTFTTVTAPTAGSAPVLRVGSGVTGSGSNLEGFARFLSVIDGALPTGQVVVLEAAAQKLAQGG